MDIGERFGPYELIAVLGKGGAATVFRARDTRDGAVVALKVLARKWLGHPRVERRFLREAKLLEHLAHPGIPRLIALLREPIGLAIVQELAEGLTLAELIESDGILSGARCVPWFVAVLDALGFAHERGVLHRDIKPANIVVGLAGVKLIDFGLAHIDASQRLTADGTTVGTIQFIPREQARGEALDERCDIYALGVSLYLALTGASPFPAKTVEELLRAVLHTPATPLREHWPIIDPALEGIVLKAIEKDREQRFKSARDMKGALVTWLRSTSSSRSEQPL